MSIDSAQLRGSSLELPDRFAGTNTRRITHWIEPMKKVHARFTGTNGTFAHFGDSITVTMAFWFPLALKTTNMGPEMTRAPQLVKGYQKPESWYRWKGPGFGNHSRMTIGWEPQ